MERTAYAELAAAVIGKFVTDIPAADLGSCARHLHGEVYATAGPTATRRRSRRSLAGAGLALLECRTGRARLKDMAMQLLGRPVRVRPGQKRRALNILAPLRRHRARGRYAMRAGPAINVFMLSPLGG